VQLGGDSLEKTLAQAEALRQVQAAWEEVRRKDDDVSTLPSNFILLFAPSLPPFPLRPSHHPPSEMQIHVLQTLNPEP
jgi:hypothetical protein